MVPGAVRPMMFRATTSKTICNISTQTMTADNLPDHSKTGLLRDGLMRGTLHDFTISWTGVRPRRHRTQ
ncbi:hypothetical protein ACFFX0_20230 [Citricoccus parietis]|uniref:Uncharacterized protein n=1 Tax=Citricoccus parietis TaxID=592307 RepID=A0ABV5G421_9MICC